MKEIIENAVQLAEIGKSNLNDDKAKSILGIEGFTGIKVRHFLNNVCASLNPHYLEVGLNKGATFLSAVFQNSGTYYGVDNWKQYGDFHEEIEKIIQSIDGAAQVKILNENCFELEREDIPDPINVFFYDADHSYQGQYLALTHFEPFFDDDVMLIVNDYRHHTHDKISENVRLGTQDGIKDIDFDIVYEKELYHPKAVIHHWWAGLYVAHLRRRV